jgi:hypothetical protein
MDAVAALAPGSGLIAAACTALGLSRDLVAWRLCEAFLDVEAASIMLFE